MVSNEGVTWTCSNRNNHELIMWMHLQCLGEDLLFLLQCKYSKPYPLEQGYQIQILLRANYALGFGLEGRKFLKDLVITYWQDWSLQFILLVFLVYQEDIV